MKGTFSQGGIININLVEFGEVISFFCGDEWRLVQAMRLASHLAL